MEVINALLPLAVSMLTFLSRAWPRLIMRQPPLGDTASHLAMIKAIRENRHRVPDPLPRWIPEQRLYYPTFFHWLVSFLAPSMLVQFERVSGAVIDTVHNAVAMLATYIIFIDQGIESGLAGQGAALAGLLFVLSPRLIRPRERVLFLNPRPFGNLLVSIGFLGTLWFIWQGAWLGLILGVFAFSLASITHKFALQVIVFVCPLLSIMTASAWFVIALVVGLFGAILLTGGRALRVWRSHIGYSQLYRSRIAPRFPIVRDTAWTILRNTLRALRSGGNWRREVIKLIFNNEIDWLIQLSWLVPVGYLLAVGRARPLNIPDVVLHLGAWVFGAVLVGLVTTIRPLRFLGQPTRYLEYAVLPACIILAYAVIDLPDLPSFQLAVYVLIGFFLAIVALYYAVAFMVHRRICLDDFFEVVAWLAEQPPQVVLCAPIHGFSSAVWQETRHTIIGWLGQMNDQTSEDWMDDYLLLCPEKHFVLPRDLSRIIGRYGVNLLFCGPGADHDLDRMTKSYSSGPYSVYRVT